MNLTRSENGAVLLMMFVLMITLAVVVSVYLSMVAYETLNTGGQESNARAFYLAESGLNKAVYYLLHTAPDNSTDGSWRTTAYPAAAGAGNQDPRQESLGGGTYTMWVEDSGSDIVITARGKANGVERRVRQAVRILEDDDLRAFTYVNFAGGDIDFNGAGGTARVSGDIGAGGSIDAGGVPVSGNMDVNSDVSVPTADYAAYENIAGTVVNGDKIFAQNTTSSGVWYVKGNVQIEFNATINGSIIAEGKISFTQNGGSVTAAASYPALVARGDIESNGWNNITITGAVYTEGDLKFSGSNNFKLTGSVVTVGNIDLSDANNFQLTFIPLNPPYFSGGGTGVRSIEPVPGSWEEIS